MSPSPPRQPLVSCPNCGIPNEATNKYCISCQMPMNRLDAHEEVIERGIDTFIETARALLDAEKTLTPDAFDTFCRVHVGASAPQVQSILDMVRGSL